MSILEQLKDIETFRDAVEYLRENQIISCEQAYEWHGFGLLPGTQKDRLVGVPFLILEYNFISGPDSEYVEFPLITTNNERYLMRDRSRGIYLQLKETYAKRVAAGTRNPHMVYYARKGLSYQTNTYTKSDGSHVRPRTYFLS